MLWEVPCQAQQQPVRKEVSFEIRFFSEYRCRDWGECKKWQQTCAQNEAEHKGVVTTDVQCETFCHQNQMKPAVKWPVTKSSCCLIGCCTCYWREALPAEHVLRLPPHHPSRAILDFDPGSFGWKRPGGAPRTRWIDVVRRDLDQLGLDPAAIEPLAQDRDEWRALVNLVGSTHDTPKSAVHEIRWWWWRKSPKFDLAGGLHPNVPYLSKCFYFHPNLNEAFLIFPDLIEAIGPYPNVLNSFKCF